MEQKRVFVGIDLPAAAKDAVAQYISKLRTRFPNVRARWLTRENLHITLKFVGEVTPEELESLDRMVCSVAGRFREVEAVLEGTGNFAQRKIRSDALWIGIKANALTDVAQTLTADARRPFVPHLTIARLKDPKSGRDLVETHLSSDFGPLPFRIRELLIYESTLTPNGSIYSVLSKHPLSEG